MRANRSTLVKLCLLTALAVPVQRAAVANPNQLLLGQANSATPEFTLPASLNGADTLTIDGSSSMRAMNDALTKSFTSRYDTAKVESDTNGTDTALQRLQNNEIDLAAIGRPLTADETAAGLVAVPIAREKIAIFVGPDNPFNGDINFEQFSKMFRGEITNWSQIGNGSGQGQIRFIDRPESSDTRQAFQAYPAFQTASFKSGATAEPVAADETQAVIDALGNDGIGYGIANQVMGNPAVKIVSMHQTLPDNPAYPYSQPRSYVYKGEPSPAVEGFLAVATSPEGEEAIAQVQETEGAAAAQLDGPAASATSPDSQLTARTDENNEAVIGDASGNVVAGPLAGAGGAVTALAFSPDGQTLATGTNTGKIRYWGIDGEPKGDVFDTGYGKAITELEFRDNDQVFAAVEGRSGLWDVKDGLYGATPVTDTAAGTAGNGSTDKAGGLPGWLWLIPLLALLGGVALWLLGRRGTAATPEPKRQTAPTATVPPPTTDPASDREVSSRAQSVISTDRVTEGSEGLGKSGINASADVPEPTFESTDLESPDLEGTNLDLLTPGAVLGGAALGGAVLTSGMAAGMAADLEAEDEEDEWDDNLDLTLDDSSAVPDDPDLLELPEPQITGTAATPPLVAPALEAPSVADDDDFWNTAPDDSGSDAQATSDMADEFTSEFINDADTTIGADSSPDLSNLETIEPTRDTIIAETDTVPDIEPDQNTIIGDRAVIFRGAAATILAAEAATDSLTDRPSEPDTTGTDADDFFAPPAAERPVDAAAGDDDSNTSNIAAGLAGGAAAVIAVTTVTTSRLSVEELASVDEGLPELPDGYGDSRIVLLPRDPKWAYAYWDISNEHKEELRRQGGQRLMLRLYDVTDVDQTTQAAHGMQQQDCHEMARSWYIEIPVSDRDYTAELGYLTADDRWLMLARSAPVRIPPIYPSSWVKDQFVTVGWDESLAGRGFGNLGRPDEAVTADGSTTDSPPIYSELFALTQQQQAMRLAGSLFGSMQLAPESETSFSPSGMTSGLNESGLTMSGVGVSGVGMVRSRNFWLVADAELIVYGATEPNATVTAGEQVIPLNPDGTFRFHMPFPDGQISYPIRAVAADGEQSRSIQMDFERETPERNTNPKEDAEDEWF